MPEGKKELFRVSLELEGERRMSGNNLFELLYSIKKHGSISRAASALDLSYRYAWGLLREAEKALGIKLVEKQVGGASGGGASLTYEANNLLEQYNYFKEEVNDQLERFVNRPKTSSGDGGSHVFNTPEKHVLLASTMEPVEAGLLDVLEQAFYESSGILVRHIAAGSGRSLDIAREGRVDMVLTHAPELEEQFMAEGMGSERIPVMSNDFVVVGPHDKSAKICTVDGDVTEVFRRIALYQFAFVCRGDQSGTHLCEQKIWKAAGITPGGQWYITSSGAAGNLGVLRLAQEKKAFTLVDQASYMLSKSENNLQLVFNKENSSHCSGLMDNNFVIILLNPGRFPFINNHEAKQFAGWLQSEGKQIIASFGEEKYGGPLFSTV